MIIIDQFSPINLISKLCNCAKINMTRCTTQVTALGRLEWYLTGCKHTVKNYRKTSYNSIKYGLTYQLRHFCPLFPF